MNRILLIEKNEASAERLRNKLHLEHIDMDTANSGQEALMLLGSQLYDLIIASDELPDMVAERLLIELRSATEHTQPIMLLSDIQDVRRRVRYYRLGANDILSKELNMEEFIAKIWSILKVAGKGENRPIHVDGFYIDPASQAVMIDDQPVQLTPTEFELLLYLARNEGKALSRDQILAHVWGYAFAGETNLVDVYIRYLRLKIDKKYKKKWIHTVRGFGYRFDLPN